MERREEGGDGEGDDGGAKPRDSVLKHFFMAEAAELDVSSCTPKSLSIPVGLRQVAELFSFWEHLASIDLQALWRHLKGGWKLNLTEKKTGSSVLHSINLDQNSTTMNGVLTLNLPDNESANVFVVQKPRIQLKPQSKHSKPVDQ